MDILLLYRKNIMLNPVLETPLANQTGFFDWFSAPSEVAHLATVKKQPRENNSSWRKIKCKYCQTHVDHMWSAGTHHGLFPKTSIKQYLPVLAMSTLTTSDLEINSISIVTPVDDYLSFNTAAEELRGEETQMSNALTVDC